MKYVSGPRHNPTGKSVPLPLSGTGTGDEPEVGNAGGLGERDITATDNSAVGEAFAAAAATADDE